MKTVNPIRVEGHTGNVKINIIHQNRNGFTLIEIMVVLIILGVLASIVQYKLVDLEVSAENSAEAVLAGKAYLESVFEN